MNRKGVREIVVEEIQRIDAVKRKAWLEKHANGIGYSGKPITYYFHVGKRKPVEVVTCFGAEGARVEFQKQYKGKRPILVKQYMQVGNSPYTLE